MTDQQAQALRRLMPQAAPADVAAALTTHLHPTLPDGRAETQVFLFADRLCVWVGETLTADWPADRIEAFHFRNGVGCVSVKSVSDHLFSDGQAQEYFDFGQALENLGRIVLPLALALQKEDL